MAGSEDEEREKDRQRGRERERREEVGRGGEKQQEPLRTDRFGLRKGGPSESKENGCTSPDSRSALRDSLDASLG